MRKNIRIKTSSITAAVACGVRYINMGAWGVEITSDDTVLDIKGELVDLLKRGVSISDASEKVIIKYKNLDSDERPLLWLTLALVQWKYDTVSKDVLKRVRSDIASESGLDAWKEDPELFEKRKIVLEKFLSKIESPNPNRARIPKLIVREAPFKIGDCLSVLVEGDLYSAAIVLDVNNSDKEDGLNLVGCLDYLSSTPPTINDFKKKKWLKVPDYDKKQVNDICWYSIAGFEEEKTRFNLVGNIRLGWFKPKYEDSYAGWIRLCTCIIH